MHKPTLDNCDEARGSLTQVLLGVNLILKVKPGRSHDVLVTGRDPASGNGLERNNDWKCAEMQQCRWETGRLTERGSPKI